MSAWVGECVYNVWVNVCLHVCVQTTVCVNLGVCVCIDTAIEIILLILIPKMYFKKWQQHNAVYNYQENSMP